MTATTASAIILFSFVAFSCSNSKPGPDEFRKFGERIVKYLATGDDERLENLYNPDTAYRRVLKLTKVPATSLNEENSRLIKMRLYEHFIRLLKRRSLGTDSVQFFLSRVYEAGNVPHVVVTIDQRTHFNFIDFELMVGKKIQIADYYDYLTCDNFSDIFSNTELVKLTGVAFGHSGYERALGELRLVQSYVNANDFRRAWITFNKIEYRYQRERLFQEAKLHITKELGDSLYLGSLATSITSFRDDEKLRISRSFQFYQHARQMREAAITLDSLEALVGASPVIDRMRSGLN